MTNYRQHTAKHPPLPPFRRCSSAWLWLLPFLLMGSLWLMPVTTQAAPPAQSPDKIPSVGGGRAGWSETCLPCHGPTGKGDGPTAVQEIEDPLPDFSNPETARLLVPADNFVTIKNGRLDQGKLMPPWGEELNDAQIWDKTAYIWSLSTTDENISAGKTIYLDQCIACHGESGAGDGPEATAEMSPFTDLEAMVQRSQANLQTNYMATEAHNQLDALSHEELWQVLDFIRTFSFKVPERNGVVFGQVVNATTNQPESDFEVTLHAFQDEAEALTLSVRTDENGYYRFEELVNDHTMVYLVEGIYQDIGYEGDEPGMFVPDDLPEVNVDLKVYNTTTDSEAISLTQLHYLISFSPNTVNVIQVFVVSNRSNQSYIGQDGQTFHFALPGGATNVSFQNNFGNTRFVETETGYADTEPVLPGEEGLTIAALYNIPYDGDSLTVEAPIPVDAALVDVLMNNPQVELGSEQVEFVETRQFQGNTFAIYRGDSLNQGDMFTFNLTGLDDLSTANLPNIPEHEAVSPGSSFDQSTLGWIVMGIGSVIIVLAGIVYPMTRPQPLADPTDFSEVDPETNRQKLLLMLAQLDQVFEAGELDEAVYHQARAKYKAELIAIMEITD